jgi:sulfate/thiosulfate transport system ATP-binding protein
MSVDVTGISKTFGAWRALRNVSLSVPTGQLVALLGPSGSGKTTLLRIIAGLEHADEGSGAIRFHGEDVTDDPLSRRRVGFVFQHYALFRHMSVFENVAFGLRVRPRETRPSRADIGQRVRRLLKLVQLEGLADRFPHQLSGGQRQRIALARALAVEPRVLLLDEPFGALDAKVRHELRRWLRRLHDEIHVTSLFVTHDQEEALDVADTVVVMDKGGIEQEGSPAEVFHAPANAFVMDFLGQVNRLRGRVSRGTVDVLGITLPAPQHASAPPTPATVFVRPHELRLSARANGRPCFPARITRVHAAGPCARITLKAPGDLPLQADIALDELAGLDARIGAEIFVTPCEIRVFLDAG